MATEIITKDDLNEFRELLLGDIRQLLSGEGSSPQGKWLKSYQVKNLLKISASTLQNLRVNGTIPFTRIGSIIYYIIIKPKISPSCSSKVSRQSSANDYVSLLRKSSSTMPAASEILKKYQAWKRQQITTPTFRLMPVEKPDMSPFLIHMTGKDSMTKILKGEGAPSAKAEHGFLKSAVPETGGSGGCDAAVVCFTESPVFALDFFRFRSDRRWMQDQQYGIGFSKERLILDHGVRPVVCLDSRTNSALLALCNRSADGSQRLATDEATHRLTQDLLAKLKPLLFPMLEHAPLQGFMWEREWRYPSSDGWQFPHSAIELICCPAGEREEILRALGPLKDRIHVVESWKEYNELTTFLKDREAALVAFNLESIYEIQDIDQLLKLEADCATMLTSLDSYRQNLKAHSSQFSDPKLDQTIDHLWEYYQRIEEQLTNCKYLESTQFAEEYNAWELSQRWEE